MRKAQRKGNTRRDKTTWPLDLFEILDIPRELVLDLPRVTQIGDLQLLIENYLGLQHFNSDRIEVITKSGLLRVTGESLAMSYISTDELLIRGRIAGFAYVAEEKKK